MANVVSAASLLGSLGVPANPPASAASSGAPSRGALSTEEDDEVGNRTEMDLRLLFESRRGVRPLLTGPSARIPQRALNSELTCPVCLGIIRDATSVMECLHRFCSACIEKSLRFGKKEVTHGPCHTHNTATTRTQRPSGRITLTRCSFFVSRAQCPSCRVSCPSRRNLRKDDAFNAVIAAIYPDLSKAESAQEAHIQEVIKSYNVRKFGEIASKGARQQKDQARRSTKRPASPPPSFGGHAFSAPVAKRPRNPNKPEPISIMLQQHPTLRDADPKLRDQFSLANKFVRTSRYITVLLLKKWLQLKLCKPKTETTKTEGTAETKEEGAAAAADANKMDDAAVADTAAASSSSSAAAAASSAAPAAASSTSTGLPAPVITPNNASPSVRFVLYVRAFDLQLLDATPIEQQQQSPAAGPPGQEIYVPLASDLTLDYIEEYMWNSEAKTNAATAAGINAALAATAATDADPTPLLQRAFAQSFRQCTSHRKAKTPCPEDCKDRMAAWHEYLAKEQEKFKAYKESQQAAAPDPAAAASASAPPLVSLPHKKRRLVLYYSVVGADGQLLTDVPAMAPEVVAKYVIAQDDDEGDKQQQMQTMQQQLAVSAAHAAASAAAAAQQQPQPMQMDDATAV